MDRILSKTRVVGVDVSLNRTVFAIVDVRGNIIASDKFTTKDYPLIDDFIAVLCNRIQLLIEDNGGFESIRSIGVNAPSGNFRTGSIENSPNMPWKGVIPLAALMRDRLGLAVALTRDSNVIALGESSFGIAHGMRDFAIITLGHGLGCGYFCHGKLANGHSGLAGEFGHTCIVPDGRECGCGLKGCLEAYCAEKGIIRTAKEFLAESDAPSLLRDYQEGMLTPKDITECCDKGDNIAIEVYRKTGHILGTALSNLAATIDPEAIILAGGIANAGDWLLDPLEEAFDEHIFHNLKGKVKILRSTLDGMEREVLGASVLAWEVKEYSLFK